MTAVWREDAPDQNPGRGRLRLAEWAIGLEREGLARLFSYRSASGRFTLLPYLPGEDAGLVTIWNDSGAYVSLWESVFQRRSPLSVPGVSRPSGS